ncbi:pseudouridine-5'-phosphate glycosidase [Agrococcus sp. DT81.2]|uniref:pseudouridine-5'-phosphate glycosidase n=1 Tax=Agrococcus sp. DT81.2 TaxID=3393414 RepID=UPI003CE53AC7
MITRISDEVAAAIAARAPVVALESTIFTHGLPRPRNLRVAIEAEAALRADGITPATVGVVRGQLVVGMSEDEIERLAEGREPVVKASIRDLPIAAAKGLHAGTTVAATAFAAHAAGISVFSTGGLGGVHSGAETTFDESADLRALASLPVVVVSAGVKSILDIGLTLERLESLNIPVVGYRTTNYPGFFVSDSGFDIEHSVDTPEQIAAVAVSRDALGISAALLVANPLPVDEQLQPDLLAHALTDARRAAAAAGITGKDTTPFLLDFVQQATKGLSLEVNVAAYRNNVRLGGAIARALADKRSGPGGRPLLHR